MGSLATPAAREEFPKYLSSRHEETAIAMASGYAKSTGKLPAVVLHTTVGALHATMACAPRCTSASDGAARRRVDFIR